MNHKTRSRLLPRNESSAPVFPEPFISDPAAKVLIVDDDENVLHHLSTSLARAGFSVTAVFDDEQAWDLLHHETYDLLVTHNAATGSSLVERVRHAGMSLPVRMASGSFSAETTRDFPNLQITALIPKFNDTPECMNSGRSVPPPPGDDTATPSGSSRSDASSPALARSGVTRAGNKHVLIADDDAVVRGSLAAVLQSEGYEVEEAGNGIEAVTCAIKHRPDLVLLDLNMPHADGWAAFSQLDRVAPLLPVIVITARPNQYPEAVRAGVDAFMEKPLNIPVLVRAVKRLTNEEKGRHLRRITDRAFVTKLLGTAGSGGRNLQ